MKDKVLTYAIGGSILAHVVIAGIVGSSWAAKLNSAPSISESTQRMVKVDFVRDPNTMEPVKPIIPESQPEPEPIRQPQYTSTPPQNTQQYSPSQPTPRPTPRNTWYPKKVRPTQNSGKHSNSSARVPGNPCGPLNVGSTSSNGDVAGNWGGKTSVGWVSGSENGKGKGSGEGYGTGTPEPPKHADPGPGMQPAPQPPQPPAPRMVNIRVCEASGMLPNEYCKRTDGKSFVEGHQPSRACNQCKAPEPEHHSRLADQEKPVLVRDARVNTNALDEGLDLSVEIEYTVNTEGDVTGVSVRKSSGVRAADRAAVNATSDLKYKPAVQDGVPRSVKMIRRYKIRT